MNKLVGLIFSFFLHFALLAQTNQHVGFDQLDSTGVKVSHQPGVYASSIRLSFDIPPNCDLYYSIQSGDSSGFRKYADPIAITANSFLRVRISGVGDRGLIYQGNYLIGREMTLPVICLRVRASEFFPPTGIYDGHFSGSGPHKERIGHAFEKKPIRCFVEFMYDERSVVATSCWVKTFGGFTLALPEKSLHLVADEQVGASEFRYKFFPTKPFNEFEHLVLRTSGSDQNETRFKDMSLSSLANDLGLDHMAYQPCVFYVNDEYFGIINLREKINFDYLAYNHHAKKDSTELIDMHGQHSEDYMHLFSELEDTQLAPDYNQRMEQLMDVENYMNFSILQIYISNSDSRGNIRFWKSKNLDDRWRWIFYDSDLGCRDKYQKINFLKDRISPTQTQWYNPPWATHILRYLTTHPETRDRFINQICLLQATRLNHDTIISRVDAFTNWIKPEIPFHIHRYPADHESESQWLKSIKRLKDFFEMRKETFHEHMCSTFGLDKERVTITIESNIPSKPLISANHSALRFTRISGLFYRGRSLPVEARSCFPYLFVGWKEDGLKQEERLVELSSNASLTALFEHAQLDTVLNERMGIAAFGTEMKSKDEVHWIALFNTTGKPLKLSDFKLHIFERGGSISFENSEEWKDSTYIIITTDKKKWKKRNPQFEGQVVESPWLDQFQQEMTIYLSSNQNIIDSLHVNFPDSLLTRGDRWMIWKDSVQTFYRQENAFLPNITCHRSPISKEDTDGQSISFYLYAIGGAILIVLFVLLFIIRKKYAA